MLLNLAPHTGHLLVCGKFLHSLLMWKNRSLNDSNVLPHSLHLIIQVTGDGHLLNFLITSWRGVSKPEYVKCVGHCSDKFINVLKEGEACFVLTIGTTDTSFIPGITIAGASPELTPYTPPADAEYLLLGECRVIPVPPMTPDGKPTPALISRACLRILNIPVFVASAGCRVVPKIPYIDLGGEPGRDIRTGRALSEKAVKEILNNGKLLGRELAKKFDLVIIGESIPAGTTTAMAFMVALGYDAWNKVSSASPVNPIDLKRRVVQEALRNLDIDVPVEDPIVAVSRVGDPVIVGVASIAAGVLEMRKRVLLAGGTQMCAVVAFLKHLGLDLSPDFIAVGTTRWIFEDSQSDIVGLLSSIWNKHSLYVAMFSLADVPYDGLRAYEQGFVKEGVGMGGLLVTTLIRGYSPEDIKAKVLDEYEKLLRKARS